MSHGTDAGGESLVTIDFQTDLPDLSLPYKLIGLETSHPIMQIGPKIYRGTWATTVGTEMLFDGKGEWAMNVRERLVMAPVQLKKKVHGSTKPAKTKLLRLEDMQEAAIAPDHVLEPIGRNQEQSSTNGSTQGQVEQAEASEMEIG